MSNELTYFAEKYGFSEEAVQVLVQALDRTRGQAAQFSHPELGGMGQWMPTMIMLGDMNNHALKARVNDLCHALADWIRASDQPTRPKSPLAGIWWEYELGSPKMSGGQNDLQYAYFPDKHRVAVKVSGEVYLYDTTGYEIVGISAQQYGVPTLDFQTSQGLIVTVNQFRLVE